MTTLTSFRLRSLMLLIPCVVPTPPLLAQLVCHDGFGDYSADTQVESGSNGSPGTGLDGGAGWGGPYDVRNAIKEIVRTENRTSNPVNYISGEITILGGNRALRFWDAANGSYAVQRPLGTVFEAAAGDTLWFSILFRTATGGAGELPNQDFFQIGFDDNANASAGIPRVSIGSNTTQTTFPSPASFFARSTTTIEASAFHDGISIAAATTYLLVGRVQPHAGEYDTVSLFVNPSSLDDPGPPSAEVILPSGLTFLSHAFLRTHNLDNGDVYVLDEWHVARDYGSVVQSLTGALTILPAATPEDSPVLRWPASLTGAVLEASTTLAPESWTEVTAPFSLLGSARQLPIVPDPEAPRRFFRLRR